MADAVQLVRDFYAAVEQAAHGADLERFLAPDARTREHPNALVSEGRTRDRASMLAASAAGAGLLSRQDYDMHWVRQIDDTVVARLTWRGVVAQDAGPLRRGQELTAHIAQFVRVRDGRIVEIETYDCYEPFDRAPPPAEPPAR
ncbi:MAG: nuclear transport factor 2 family protein [Actinomycetota bacterium]|nr:nuclear transport factor 2 family protein [Actinomycetota bacterium]